MTGKTDRGPRFGQAVAVGWEAALLEIEHQAIHWDTPDHGETGHLIASALRAAAEIARSGGLQCEHRQGSALQAAALLPEVSGRVMPKARGKREHGPSAA